MESSSICEEDREMLTIYVNGVKVERENLKNIEIKNERVKRILGSYLKKGGERDKI